MTPAEGHRLDRECTTFVRYLADMEADAYLLEKYRDAHQQVAGYAARSRFDHFLVKFATWGTLFTQLADSYARLGTPTSALRKKLILLLALLESSSRGSRVLDTVDAQGSTVLMLRLLQRGIIFMLSILAGASVLLPCQLAFALAEKRPKREP